MKHKLGLHKLLISLSLLAALLLLIAGCGASRQDAEQFVGTWIPPAEEDPSAPRLPYQMTLTLRSDGTATFLSGLDPHPERMTWLLKGRKLILAPRGGGPRTEHTYEFNGPDEVTLTSEGQAIVLKRRENEQRPAPEAAPPRPPSRPSSRPPTLDEGRGQRAP